MLLTAKLCNLHRDKLKFEMLSQTSLPNSSPGSGEHICKTNNKSPEIL